MSRPIHVTHLLIYLATKTETTLFMTLHSTTT